MPYTVDGNCVKNRDTGETVKCHNSHEDAVAHLQALQANVKHSGVVEMSMRISKASYNKSENEPMRWTAIDSDTDEDLYEERMSIDLYRDFVDRIEKSIPVPEAFRDAVCETDWCGGMPYLSIAHYGAGTDKKNTPGEPTSIFIDGTRLKSKGILHDNEIGRRTFSALCDDLYKKKSDPDHRPVRISIGFLDLEHRHLPDVGGQEFTFTRSKVGQICPLCAQGIGGKIYMKGQLIHLAMTRVPVNPRTEMVAERSMDDIRTKKEDAESIIGDLADGLEEKSIASDILVVRSEEEGYPPTPSPSEIQSCYDPNTGGWDNECIKSIMDKYMPDIRNSIGTPVKSTTLPKEVLDVVVAHIYKSNGLEVPVVEGKMPTIVENTEVQKAQAVEVPVVAKADMETPAKEEKEKEEVAEESAIEKAFAQLQSAIASKDATAVNKAFGDLGTATEDAFKGNPKPVDAGDIATIVRSIMEEVITPLRVEIATIKAGQVKPDATAGVVQSKALSLNPGGISVEDMVRRSGAPNPNQEPSRKLTQIEMLARRSTGLQS